jgi:hypothetical protein
MPETEITSPLAKKKYKVKREIDIDTAETPADVTATDVSEPELPGSGAEGSGKLKSGENITTGRKFAEYMGRYGTGETWRDLWKLLLEKNLQDKKIKVVIDENGRWDGTIIDPDTGKQLLAGEWKEPETEIRKAAEYEPKFKPIDIKPLKKIKVTKEKEVAGEEVPEFQAGGEVNPLQTKEAAAVSQVSGMAGKATPPTLAAPGAMATPSAPAAPTSPTPISAPATPVAPTAQGPLAQAAAPTAGNLPISADEQRRREAMNNALGRRFRVGRAPFMNPSRKSEGVEKKFHGGPVEGDYEGGVLPAKSPEQKKDPSAKPEQQAMGDKKEDFPEKKPDMSFAKGGPVSDRKMTGAQIEKEFGVKKPGDVATVYDCVIEEGKLKTATPDDAETKRFSKVVSQMDTETTAVGVGYKRNEAALQYNAKPEVGVASGAGFQAGGPVETPAETPPDKGKEGDMKGPFDSYSGTEGIDPQLVSRGDELFGKLESAVSSGEKMEAERYLDELKQFASDIDNARKDAMNDSVLAARLKEMAADARDLVAAFENIVSETESPEMEASRPGMGGRRFRGGETAVEEKA